ncbi:MAG: hypothetical protein VXX13_02640, partial [Pseudomonadota bacterium]|nr:hypothetical protein [Pseudomonadota bacterium]
GVRVQVITGGVDIHLGFHEATNLAGADRVASQRDGSWDFTIGHRLPVKKENTEDRWRDAGPTVSKTTRRVNSSNLASAKKIVESARQP